MATACRAFTTGLRAHLAKIRSPPAIFALAWLGLPAQSTERPGDISLPEHVPADGDRAARGAGRARDHGTERHELALMLADTLERGATRATAEVRKERGALFGQLHKGVEAMDAREERAFLRRVYASFTGAEIRDLSEGRGALMERLPDPGARERVRQTVLKLHSDVTQPEPSPWQARHMAIARSHGLTTEYDRQQERSLGRER